MQKHFPTMHLLALLCLIAIVNAAAVYWHLYFYLWWLDIPMHVLGGLWVALFALAWYYRSPYPKQKESSPLFVMMFAVAVTMVVGVGWELFELSAQTFIERADVHDLADTLGDLVNDFIGAVLAISVFVRMGYNRKI
jgi:succinate dehydrogenase hydrophobic anchor subunit